MARVLRVLLAASTLVAVSATGAWSQPLHASAGSSGSTAGTASDSSGHSGPSGDTASRGPAAPRPADDAVTTTTAAPEPPGTASAKDASSASTTAGSPRHASRADQPPPAGGSGVALLTPTAEPGVDGTEATISLRFASTPAPQQDQLPPGTGNHVPSLPISLSFVGGFLVLLFRLGFKLTRQLYRP